MFSFSYVDAAVKSMRRVRLSALKSAPAQTHSMRRNPGTRKVPRKWTGSPWPEVIYLGPPPIAKVEHKQLAAGRWLRPVSISWSSGQPVFIAGQPHPWMLADPAWEGAIRDYTAQLGSRRPLPGARNMVEELDRP